MGNQKITNIGTPSDDTDGVSKKYVDDKTKTNPSHSLEKTRKYIMADINEISTEYGLVADKIDNWNPSFHSNKKVLYFRENKDGSNYRYKLSFQLTSASQKDHTVAIE